MHASLPYPVLADAAQVLSEQLQENLKRLAGLLGPEAARLDRQFRQRLESWQLDPRQSKAICAVTAGSICGLLAGGAAMPRIFEELDYQGRRLAKLDLKPQQVLDALREYDKVLPPALRKLAHGQQDNLQWVREQLQFCTVLILNQAYYQVRETESRTFYELTRRELEAGGPEDLLRGVAEVLREYTSAAAAKIYVQPQLTAARIGEASDDAEAFDPDWGRSFRRIWSVPLAGRSSIEGVLQLGFETDYEWLPREQELLKSAAERCVAAIERARLLEDLAAQRDQIRGLAARMMQVEEAERRRISRELHDEAGQSLLCIRLQLEMLERAVPEACSDHRLRLREVRDLTEHTIVEMRRLIAALSPAVLQQLGLGAALRQLANRLRELTRCRVTLKLGRLHSVPKELAVITYRLIQECCNNIAKHSAARNINISVRTADGRVWLQVEDDGVGFDVEEAFARPGTYGLSGVRERVAVLGGACVVSSARAEDKPSGRTGTQLQIELPLPGRHGKTGRRRPVSP